MSGVYIIEVVPREITNYRIMKIGSTRLGLTDRSYGAFSGNFPQERFSYHELETIPASVSIAPMLEYFLINNFKWEHPSTAWKGQEWFKIYDRSLMVDFVDSLPDLVLEFYDSQRMHSAIDLSIGSLIRAKRKKMGLSQEDLGEYCKMRQASISSLESGQIGNFSTLKRVLEALDLSMIVTHKNPINL